MEVKDNSKELLEKKRAKEEKDAEAQTERDRQAYLKRTGRKSYTP